MQKTYPRNSIRTHVILFMIASAITLSALVVRKNQGSTSIVRVGTTDITVETAKTSAQIQRGLSRRDRISTDSKVQGMLFILFSRKIPTFWMKDMRFGLDFIWIDRNIVVDITEHAPPPPKNELDNPVRTYSPASPVTLVLEVLEGFVQAHNIKIGDVVVLK